MIETCVLDQRANCNPRHLIGSGWIAIPSQVSLTEEQAYRIFDLVGAWNQLKVSA